ncbi:Na+/H+ antiporter [Acetobacter sp.]|jgi:CPA1 family monovalent cation:H+ antiporter|uniref:Na+/H+ antiporter n=1 Tax=Acetobacter sp. TaxID=440 RepID=UPI0025BEECC5|nr:Na+/H+ antiporter [Acetobacter sp.]MCH4089948.1 Na+/H+ antiporter [Acetobacter sp.]MCI1298644.1 Na+/H+ antiporter [Acetobacter sp.]MCI1315209.1 Na+/H+ antiporter [Acetobacter sp.]
MQVALTVLALLVMTALSGLLGRLLPVRIPLPLLHIAAGSAVSLLGFSVPLSSDLFLLLLMPPLLFIDAYRIPMREFGELRTIILSLAVGLVVFSTVAGGYAIHWIMPAILPAAGMALAAALSPTDAVSVNSFLSTAKAPIRLTQVLNGEALLNDASGLVCFKFAVAAATTGLFSLKAASSNFVYVSLGGVLVGAGLGWLFARIELLVLRRGYDDSSSHILISLLIPYVIYLAADSIGCSGILAAVAAGMCIRLTGVMLETQIETRLRATTLWDQFYATLNGLVFIMLGQQLPGQVTQASHIIQSAGLTPWVLPLAIIGIQCAMSLLRAVWMATNGLVFHVVGKLVHRPQVMPSWRNVLVMTLAGARGAVTLAAIISLPSESDMPERTVMVVLATGVIITSLLLTTFGLPRALKLLPRNDGETPAQRELLETRITLARSSIAALQAEQARLPPDANRTNDTVSLLLTEFNERLRRLDPSNDDDGKRNNSVQRKRDELMLRLRIVRLQRRVLHSLLTDRNINDLTERAIGRQLDVREQEFLMEMSDLPQLPEPPPAETLVTAMPVGDNIELKTK